LFFAMGFEMPLIQLSKARQSGFRRVVRDAAGTIVREYNWEKPGEVLDIPPYDVPVILDDLNKTLLPVVPRPGSPGKFDVMEIDVEQVRAAIAEEDEDEGEAAPAESVVITPGDVGDVGAILSDPPPVVINPEGTTTDTTGAPDNGKNVSRRGLRPRK